MGKLSLMYTLTPLQQFKRCPIAQENHTLACGSTVAEEELGRNDQTRHFWYHGDFPVKRYTKFENV